MKLNKRQPVKMSDQTITVVSHQFGEEQYTYSEYRELHDISPELSWEFYLISHRNYRNRILQIRHETE